MLSPYRVLDLAGHRGLLCGKLLGDLGADVIKVEPPGGDPARRMGPFIDDEPNPEQSLLWMGLATNRRSITLDLGAERGRELLRRLAAKAHFLIESFAPGHIGSLGLGYQELHRLNPALIVVSVTPFGQSGPWSGLQATDLTGVALGGSMYPTGEEDRPPVRISHSPQFWLVGAASGAAGAMVAHHYRMLTGLGQHVDVSCHQAITRTLSHAPQMWDLNRVILKRHGAFREVGSTTTRISYPCLDGYVSFFYPGGAVGARSMAGLAQWMEDEGMGDPYLRETRWEEFEFGTLNQESLDRMLEPILKFFATKTKRELSDGALHHRVILFPVSDAKDLLEYEQLEARGFYREVGHQELGRSMKHVGPFVRASGHELGTRRRAPRIGEHNREVLGGELGLTDAELDSLEQGGTA